MLKRLGALLLCALFIVGLMWFLLDYMPGAVSELIYQTGYEELVEKYSEKFNVDPALVYAVIKTESNFDPNARSDIGAIGLMQMIEDSFDWIAWKLDLKDIKYNDLYEPENAIMFGCYMLGYLYDKYGCIELTAAAYHAGMGTVDGWISSGEIDPENVTADDIKGSNTAHYVEKILRAYKNYSDILTDRKGNDQNV